MTVGSIILEDY